MASERAARPATLKEVAERAGVSISTASRALNGQRNVNAELAAEVLAAAAELDYRPNVAARSLRLQRTMTFGAVFSRLDSPGTLNLLYGLDATNRGAGYSLFVANANGEAPTYTELVERLCERQVDGLFVYRPPRDIEPALDLCEQAGIPVLAVFAKPRGVRLPLVTNAPGDAIKMGIERLAELGHRSFGYIATGSEVGDFRTEIMTQVANELGIEFRLLELPEPEESGSAGAMERLVRDQIATPTGPTGIYARYRHLPRLLMALDRHGLRVPDDLSLISLGDGPWLKSQRPPIAAIVTDNGAIGRAAVPVMLRWLAGEEPPHITETAASVWVDQPSVARAPRRGILTSVRSIFQ